MAVTPVQADDSRDYYSRSCRLHAAVGPPPPHVMLASPALPLCQSQPPPSALPTSSLQELSMLPLRLYSGRAPLACGEVAALHGVWQKRG